MCKLFVTLAFSLIILLLLCSKSETHLTVNFKTATSRFSPKYFTNLTIAIKNQSVYLDMNIVKPLVPGFKATAAFLLRLSNSEKYQTLFAPTVDVCSVVISLKDSMFKKQFDSLLKVGNFMPNCPVNNGHYYVHGWKFDTSSFPTFLYPGDYRLSVYGFFGKMKTPKEEFVVKIETDVTIQRT